VLNVGQREERDRDRGDREREKAHSAHDSLKAQTAKFESSLPDNKFYIKVILSSFIIKNIYFRLSLLLQRHGKKGQTHEVW